MKLTENPQFDHFHSVDYHWQVGHGFQLTPQLEEELNMMLQYCIP